MREGEGTEMTNRWISGILLLVWVVVPAGLRGQQPAYLNPSQPLEHRVDDLISRLTLQEKVSLLSTTAPAIDRLKIPAMNGWNQSLHGIVWSQPTTMFPVPINMAATWNPQLVREIQSAIGDEGRAIYNLLPTLKGKSEPDRRSQLVTTTADGKEYRHNGLVYRSPVVNIDRDPRWGRIYEAFGEDPWLASRMTVASVQGLQGDDPKYLKLAATVKHYAVNNQERDRIKLNATVSERMLREYFLPQFRAGIVEGKAQSIMSSYNAVNGVPAAENKWLLTDVLRGEWKFDGFVVPDSGAVPRLVTGHKEFTTVEEAAAKTILAGSDLDNLDYAIVLPKALEKGFLSEKDVDQALRHVLKVRFRLGEFDPPDMVPYSKISPDVIDSPAHRQLALRAARESIVLLTNKNSFLPLDRNRTKTIAVIGPFANREFTGIGYTGLASEFVTPLEGIQKKLGSQALVLYARGSGVLESDDPKASYAQAVEAAKKADVAVVFAGLDELLEGEGRDRSYLDLPAIQRELIEKVYAANPRTILVLLNGGPISVVWGKEHLPAIVEMFTAGEEGGTAIADVLFGDYNPGAKLPYTVYDTRAASNSGSGDTYDQLPPGDEYDITKGFTYMYYSGKPVYPFGHGLSYTTFRYSNLKVSSGELPKGELQVQVDVENSGQRAGDEVVQLYVHDLQASVVRPHKQLVAFERVGLQPGEKKTVHFSVRAEQMAFWDTNRKAWVLEPGAFDVMAGSSSEDIRLRQQFQLSSPAQWSAASAALRASN
jgi:beta-glucosidase